MECTCYDIQLIYFNRHQILQCLLFDADMTPTICSMRNSLVAWCVILIIFQIQHVHTYSCVEAKIILVAGHLAFSTFHLPRH